MRSEACTDPLSTQGRAALQDGLTATILAVLAGGPALRSCNA